MDAQIDEQSFDETLDLGHILLVSNKNKLFANAINTAAAMRTGIVRNGLKLIEATSIKEHSFPRSNMAMWSKDLNTASKARLVRTLRDGDCLWIVVPA